MLIERIYFDFKIVAHNEKGEKKEWYKTRKLRTELVNIMEELGVTIPYNAPYKWKKERAYMADIKSEHYIMEDIREHEYYEPIIVVSRSKKN